MDENIPKMTIKQLIDKGQLLLESGVTTRDKMCQAVQTLVEIDARVEKFRASIREDIELENELAEQVMKYIDTHPNAMTEPFAEVQDGVERGRIVTSDGCEYRCTRTKRSNPKRIDEDGVVANMTQGFLKSLAGERPEWVKSELKLDASALKRSNPDDDTLKKLHLVYMSSNVWTREK